MTTINNLHTGEIIARAESFEEAELYIRAYKLQDTCYICGTLDRTDGRNWADTLTAAAPYLLAGFIGALVTVAIGG